MRFRMSEGMKKNTFSFVVACINVYLITIHFDVFLALIKEQPFSLPTLQRLYVGCLYLPCQTAASISVKKRRKTIRN